MDFLSTAITSFNREEEDSSKAPPEDREEAVQISEGLGSSRQGTSGVRMDQSINDSQYLPIIHGVRVPE